MSWIPTQLSGISYSCTGGNGNILSIRNANDGWMRVEYDDGSGWRYVLLAPRADHADPLAECHDHIQWRLAGAETIEEHVVSIGGGVQLKVSRVADAQPKSDSNAAAIPVEGSAQDKVTADWNPASHVLAIRNGSAKRVRVQYRTSQLLCSAWIVQDVDPGTTEIKVAGHQMGICHPVKADY